MFCGDAPSERDGDKQAFIYSDGTALISTTGTTDWIANTYNDSMVKYQFITERPTATPDDTDYIIFSDTSDNEYLRKGLIRDLYNIPSSSSPPSSPQGGTIYFDTDDNKLKVYNGATWDNLN